MAVSFGASGTVAYSAAGGGSVAPAYPASISAGDLLVLVVAQKPSTANSGTATPPGSGVWTLQAERSGANDGDTGGYTTTLAADQGNVNLWVWTTEATGSESGTVSVTLGTNNTAWARIFRFAKGSGAWEIASATGKDVTSGTAFSATMGSDPGITSGDMLLLGFAYPTDGPTAMSGPSFTASGATISTPTTTTFVATGAGNDIGGEVFYTDCSAGTATAAGTFAGTHTGANATNYRGPAFVLRVREGSSLSTVGDTIETVWNVSAAVGDTVATPWNTLAAVGDTVATPWNTLAALGDTIEARWALRAAVGASKALPWDVRATVGDAAALLWNLGGYAGRSLAVPFDTLTPTTRNLTARFDTRVLVGDAAALLWDTLENPSTFAVGGNLSALWETLVPMGRNRTLLFGTRANVGETQGVLWNVLTPAARGLSASWEVREPIGTVYVDAVYTAVLLESFAAALYGSTYSAALAEEHAAALASDPYSAALAAAIYSAILEG